MGLVLDWIRFAYPHPTGYLPRSDGSRISDCRRDTQMSDILSQSTELKEFRKVTAGGAHRLSTADLIDRIREQAAMPMECATSLPGQAYTDPEFFEVETDAILKKDWHAIARAEQ